ncbi:MAG: DUF167 domain-containing protein [Gemmatimonadetes bacterium]|nr:DUF167 domain-containing protein [Gemmatimonadota bacterium]
MGIPVQQDDQGALFWVHVQPRAHHAGVAGAHGDALKVRVAAAPQGGRANEEVREVLASILGVPLSRVEILSGERSRRKRVRVSGITTAEIAALLPR